jgi:predicted RNase H-like nuclease (RuvC/YqgF family)
VTSTIAEVLNLPSEGLVNLSSVSELASKAKGLQSDNRRLRDEMRDLAAEREALSLEIERLRSAMRDVVRVAEIIAIPQCRCRSASSSIPSSPASSIFPHTHTDS